MALGFLRNFFSKKTSIQGEIVKESLCVPKSRGNRFVVSDIHGCLQTFIALLEKIDLKNDDQLFLLGDYIDRGPDSVGLVDFLIELNRNPNIFLLRGNHEEELLLMEEYGIKSLIESNLTKEKLEDFYNSDLLLVPKYKDFFDSLIYFIELDEYFLVHAGFDFDLEKPFEDISSMLEIRNWRYDENLAKNKTIIFGHSPKEFGDIVRAIESNDKRIPLDNECVYNDYKDFGRLLCLNLNNMELLVQKNID